jgi:hypothetical protein
MEHRVLIQYLPAQKTSLNEFEIILFNIQQFICNNRCNRDPRLGYDSLSVKESNKFAVSQNLCMQNEYRDTNPRPAFAWEFV